MLGKIIGTAERAILLHACRQGPEAETFRHEFVQLATSAGANVVGWTEASSAPPNPRLFIGTGKADALGRLVVEAAADVVLLDHFLTPSQERNLEFAIKCRVVDRTRLILDIFAQRATTFEGKLQVELAQLRHMSTRLIRGWTHLERQKGGIGLRGPGETQLETDRRLIRLRIGQLQRRLERVRKSRDLAQRSRRRTGTPLVALVGYTNAGKSTLFNRLTGANGYTADRLFATLDPLSRRVMLPGLGPVIFTDTVGFIRDLPHDLVAAFRATLEQVVEADMLLHVIDAQPEQREERIGTVRAVVEDIGAGSVPVLQVLNKSDLVVVQPIDVIDQEDRLQVSAQTGSGLDRLVQAIVHRLRPRIANAKLRLPADEGRLRSELHALGVVASETFEDSGECVIEVNIAVDRLRKLLKSAVGVTAMVAAK